MKNNNRECLQQRLQYKIGTGTNQIWAREEGKHETQRDKVWHYSPLPNGASRAVHHPMGSGGGQGTGGRITGLQSGAHSGSHGGSGDSGGHGEAGSSGGHGGGARGMRSGAGPWRSRELGWPWRIGELGRPWRIGELGWPWWDRLRDRVPSPRLGLFGRSPTTPPKHFLGENRGYIGHLGAHWRRGLLGALGKRGLLGALGKHGLLGVLGKRRHLGAHGKHGFAILSAGRLAILLGAVTGGPGWAADSGNDLPRTAGLGEPRTASTISCERRVWGSRGRRRRFPANGGSGWAADGGDNLPRTAGLDEPQTPYFGWGPVFCNGASPQGSQEAGI